MLKMNQLYSAPRVALEPYTNTRVGGVTTVRMPENVRAYERNGSSVNTMSNDGTTVPTGQVALTLMVVSILALTAFGFWTKEFQL